MSGQNQHLNPVQELLFDEGMSDVLLRGENRTVRSFKGKRKKNLLLSGETSEMIRGIRGVRICEKG